MKQFIRNILSHVKREQVKEKIKTSLSWRDEDLYINKPALYTGTDFTLNVATMKEQLISQLFIQMTEISKLSLRMMKTNNVINLFHNLNYETLGLEN